MKWSSQTQRSLLFVFQTFCLKKLEWALTKGERVVESKNKNIDLETSTGTLPKKNLS